MTWSPEDVTDRQATRCEALHNEPRTDCGYCPTRASIRVCARCETELWPHETCPNHPTDEPALVVDGFGTAVVTLLPGAGKAAA